MTQEGGTMRKSNSYEPLAGRNNESSSENEESPQIGTRLGGRIKSSSMSPLKSNTMSSDSPSLDEDQPGIESGTGAFLKPESEDDVFVDRFPGDDLPKEIEEEQAQWPKSPEEMRQRRELALVEHADSGGDDPQGIYPPTACIFVANLTQTIRDEVLENEVSRVFSRFGSVYVKIRRDSQHMPFAFCQFTRDEDAEKALEDGKGIVLFGRPCRTKRAKANSVFIVHKLNGDPITEGEAFEFLDPIGDISNIEMLDETVRRDMSLPPSAVVYFKMYDSRRDVSKFARGQKRYVIIPYEPKKTPTPSSTARHADRQAQLAQYEIDRRSAYFGNLPHDMTQVELQEMAASCGLVRKVTLNRKSYRGGAGETVFGFVEFLQPNSVDDVVKNFNCKNLRGYIISVQLKQSRSFDTTRGTPYGTSPTPRVRTSYGGMTPTGPSSYNRGYRSTPTGPSSLGRRGAITPGRGAGYDRGAGPSPAGPSSGGRGFASSPAAPSSFGRGSGSWGRVSGRTAYSSQTSSYAGPSRTPIRGQSSILPQASSSAPRGPRRMPIPVIPERVSSAKHSHTKTVSAFSTSKDDEHTTPKGKGKAPMRPYQLPVMAGKQGAGFSPQTGTTGSEEKANSLIEYQAKEDSKSEHDRDSKQPEENQGSKETEVSCKAEGSSATPKKSDVAEEGHQTASAEGKNEDSTVPKRNDDNGEEGQHGKDEKPFNPPRAPRAHYAPSPPGPYYPPFHPSYSMPYGYIPPQMPAYGEPGMPYPAPGPFAPNLHPAVLNSFMGYPPGFIWPDVYGNPMYTGMGPGGQVPPPLPHVAGPPPTPTRSGGSPSAGRDKGSGPSPQESPKEPSKESLQKSHEASPKTSPNSSPKTTPERPSEESPDASSEAPPETAGDEKTGDPTEQDEEVSFQSGDEADHST